MYANLKHGMFVLGHNEHDITAYPTLTYHLSLQTSHTSPPPTTTINLSPGTPHVSPLISHLSPLMPHNPHILHLTLTAHLPRSPLTHTANHHHNSKALKPSRNLALTLTLTLSPTLTPTLTLTVTPMLTLTLCTRRFALSSHKTSTHKQSTCKAMPTDAIVNSQIHENFLVHV